MFDHVSIGVRDISRSRAFYDAALQPLGYGRLSTSDDSLGYGDSVAGLWISLSDAPVPANPKSGLHFCFRAPNREAVARFHAAALAAAAATTARRESGSITAQTIMQPLSSIPTATGSKPCISEPDCDGDYPDLA